MMYPYLTFSDETLVTHSHLIDKDGVSTVDVHFERPTSNGFDSARCTLPSYKWVFRDGYTNYEVEQFEQFLRSNAHLIYRYAEVGGMKIA